MAIQARKKLADLVIDEIKLKLKNGTLKEGDRLPNQNEFAEQMGVSRQSLREAYHTLQMMGVIAQKPKVGTIIISGNPDKWINNIEAPLLSDAKATRELVDARKLIEPAIAEIAVEKILPEELEDMQKIISEMEEASSQQNEETYFNLDIKFHLLIAKASKNRYLINMYMSILNLMEQFIREYYHKFPPISEDSIKTHIRICNSFKENNKKMVLHNVKDHIANIESLLDQTVPNND